MSTTRLSLDAIETCDETEYRDRTTGRSWTDGRLNCLRGRTVVTSHLVVAAILTAFLFELWVDNELYQDQFISGCRALTSQLFHYLASGCQPDVSRRLSKPRQGVSRGCEMVEQLQGQCSTTAPTTESWVVHTERHAIRFLSRGPVAARRSGCKAQHAHWSKWCVCERHILAKSFDPQLRRVLQLYFANLIYYVLCKEFGEVVLLTLPYNAFVLIPQIRWRNRIPIANEERRKPCKELSH
eukprot:6199509-Pleurochrysis_carterae.AAC.3